MKAQRARCHRLPLRVVLAVVAVAMTLATSQLYAQGSQLAAPSTGLNALANSLGNSTTLDGGSALEPEFLPVEEAYILAVEPASPSSLRLIWQMPPGYYLYKHAFRFSAERDGGEISLTPSYPTAITREDEFFGRVEVFYDSVELVLDASAPLNGSTIAIASQGCADAGLCYPPRTQRFQIEASGLAIELQGGAAPPVSKTIESGAPAASASAFLFMLLLAFAGGAILNLMPCVLPILSLKVLSFACATPQERHHHGLLYSAGVISSFVAVAALLLTLRGAGQAVGWGFQLQSPGFVIALAYLFVVLGLGLSGFLELGNRFMNIGSGLADKGGASGSFFTGVLAVVVASPCTAPFMGTALGFALVQPAFSGLGIFAALGVGMAAPMLLLSYSELARRLMPKPGAWMDRLKQALAFPLYATALWLFWVAGRQAGVDLMAAALLGALLLALGLWLWRGAWVARSAGIACLVLAVVLASWRPVQPLNGEAALPAGSVAFSQSDLDRLRNRGEVVFVDVTADWCITCLANEQAVLGTREVQDAFDAPGVTYMVADWTDYDPGIADFVASHGRSGIPLYVMYAGQSAPRLLPQLLRKQTVLDALETAKGTDVTASR